jgi:hypothetical protein
MDSLQDVLLKEFSYEADRGFATCDAYDMKANVLLVVMAFLAAQTAYFISIAHSPIVQCGQFLSGLLLTMCGVLALAELLPRDFMAYSPSNGAIEKKIAKLRMEHDGNDEQVLRNLVDAQIGWARERAISNKKINRSKSRLLTWAFWTLSGAVIINLLTLVALSIHPFSLVH